MDFFFDCSLEVAASFALHAFGFPPLFFSLERKKERERVLAALTSGVFYATRPRMNDSWSRDERSVREGECSTGWFRLGQLPPAGMI